MTIRAHLDSAFAEQFGLPQIAPPVLHLSKGVHAPAGEWKEPKPPVAPILLIPILSSTFLPSSKTAAAMIVIPAIANNERFQAEASDLYDLAKQVLKKIVASDEEKPESK